MNIFFNNTIEIYTVTLMSIFKDVFIKINNKNIYNVPLVYGNFEKYSLARKYMEENLDSTLNGNTLRNYPQAPIMSFYLNSFGFNPQKDKVNNTHFELIKTGDNIVKNRLPVPLNYNFNLKIWTRNLNHLGQIIENIYLYFVRPYSIKVKDFKSIDDVARSVLVELTNTDIPINQKSYQDGDADNYETFSIDLPFLLKGYMYYPIKSEVGTIEEIHIQFQEKDKGEDFATQYSKSISDYIDTLEELNIKELKKHGAFKILRDDGQKTLNDFIEE